MSNALITGGTGFLGKRLAYRLLELGWIVTAFGRNETIGKQLHHDGIRFVRGDLRNREQVMKACTSQDIVFHCGALSSPWGVYSDFYGCNVAGTNHIVEGCFTHHVNKLVHVSTPSIYFDYTDRFQISEASPLPNKPVNHYAATKRLAERIVANAHSKGLPSIMIRPRAIFGPGDTTLLPRLIRANHHRGIPLFRNGSITMDLTYVDNVVDALLLCADAPHSAMGLAYNITNQEPVNFKNALTQLFSGINQRLNVLNLPYAAVYGLAVSMELKARLLRSQTEPLLTRYSVGVLGKHQTLDNTLARENLGYSPKVGVDEGIRRFADWWKQHES